MKEVRLINADKLRKDVLDLPNCYNGFSDTYDKAMIIDLVDEQPTVDAEPVVRCKDCKYFDHSDFGKGEEYWCKRFVSTDDYTHCHKVSEDDFCAWGERRENAETD